MKMNTVTRLTYLSYSHRDIIMLQLGSWPASIVTSANKCSDLLDIANYVLVKMHIVHSYNSICFPQMGNNALA